jgi:hypothetical protein
MMHTETHSHTATSAQQDAGAKAEAKVMAALGRLPAPWQAVHTVEWRLLGHHGEQVGEADVVVFHPLHGVVVLEIKAGAIRIDNGVWHYGSGLVMKQSPFAQARRNRFALLDKLRHRLGRDAAEALTVTHGAWFPDVNWKGALPGAEMPSRVFLLDRSTLADPEPALLKLFQHAQPDAVAWTRTQQHALKELLAPDCHQLVPLAVRVEDTVAELQQATAQQIKVLRALRLQLRLLVEGGAGTGKTVLAATLAREHAALGKRVLLTCFNKALAQSLAQGLADVPGITVLPFHDLAQYLCQQAGVPYRIPTSGETIGRFFREDSPELLLQATEALPEARFDSLIVDEAADFAPTWWIALEALGASGFSWCCFYDRQQSLFQSGQDWQAPFAGSPMLLDTNLRNTRPIGELAAQLGRCTPPSAFRLDHGELPVVQYSPHFEGMVGHLRQLLKHLLDTQHLRPEQLVILSPYKHTNAASTWAKGLDDFAISTNMVNPPAGHIRIGTVQGFKGLESDVVVLAGLDSKVSRHPELLYVGISRARAALYVLALDSTADVFDLKK